MPEQTERQKPDPEREQPASVPDKPRPRVPFVPPPIISEPDKAVKVEWPAWAPDREPDKV